MKRSNRKIKNLPCPPGLWEEDWLIWDIYITIPSPSTLYPIFLKNSSWYIEIQIHVFHCHHLHHYEHFSTGRESTEQSFDLPCPPRLWEVEWLFWDLYPSLSSPWIFSSTGREENERPDILPHPTGLWEWECLV